MENWNKCVETLNNLAISATIKTEMATDNPELQQRVNVARTAIEDVQSEIERMRNDRYLQNHMYETWQGNDGRWRTYLPDSQSKNGRKLIAKSTEEKLNIEIIRFYKAQDEDQCMKSITMKDWYPKWLEYKALQTRADMYIRRIGSDWENYGSITFFVGFRIPLIAPAT
ncbi:MAG: hypothetical protein LUI13_02865, partial [Lachnospiraceae bacterium]|nr:hypothetical protein [Lachnospiraceae bacterium]